MEVDSQMRSKVCDSKPMSVELLDLIDTYMQYWMPCCAESLLLNIYDHKSVRPSFEGMCYAGSMVHYLTEAKVIQVE